MKRLTIGLILVSLFLPPLPALARPTPPARQNPHATSPGRRIVDRMKFPPMKWRIPQVGVEVTRRVLPNGLVVYLLPDASLPRIQVRLLVRGGRLHEPLERAGLAGLASRVQRTGGTRAYAPRELDRRLEIEAVDLETDLSDETSSVSLDVLTDGLSTGLELLAEVALRPRFDSDRLEIAREQVHETLRRQNDRPAGIVDREFRHLLYGDDPAGRKLRWPAVQALTVEDLKAWHSRLWTPDRAYLAVAGDFQPEAMMASLDRVFGNWRPNGQALPEVSALGPEPAAGVFLVERALNQSYVALGHLGVGRDDPDREAVQVMDYILGAGSFSSRLVEVVRNREGLAYSVRSAVSTESPRRGLFKVTFQTRTDATHRALDLVLTEIERMRALPVSAVEVQQARASLLNSMVFRFDDPFETVGRLVALEALGLPADHDQAWAARLQGVTVQDVQRVARRVLHPDRLVILVVGDPSAFDRSLGDLAPARSLELEVVP